MGGKIKEASQEGGRNYSCKDGKKEKTFRSRVEVKGGDLGSGETWNHRNVSKVSFKREEKLMRLTEPIQERGRKKCL